MTKSDAPLDVFAFGANSKRTTSRRYVGRPEDLDDSGNLTELSESGSMASVLEKLEALNVSINNIQNKQETLEKRLFTAEFKGCQMEQKIKNQTIETQSIYKDIVDNFVQSLEKLQFAFMNDSKKTQETLAGTLKGVAQEVALIRMALQNRDRNGTSNGNSKSNRDHKEEETDYKEPVRRSSIFGKAMESYRSYADITTADLTSSIANEKEAYDVEGAESSEDESEALKSIDDLELDSIRRSKIKVEVNTTFTTLYYDVGVYVPYSSLRKQLRRHGVQSSLILNMYYRRGGIVEIVTYQSSTDVLIHDLAKLPSWTKVDNYNPVFGCLESKKDDVKDISVRELKSLICSYFTTVHAAILTSNGSEALKSYYKINALENCEKFLKEIPSSPCTDLEQLWSSCNQS